jgi:hypothetical protein
MSLTNKIVANIKKTNADVRSFVSTTNVVCIDTCNNRIGINTKNPRYSIDISGTGPTNLIYVNKLEVAASASIRDISCLNNIDASSAKISNINYTTISGVTIKSNTITTISAQILDLSISKLALTDFSAVNIDVSYLRVYNKVDVCGNMTIRNLTVTGDFSGGSSRAFTNLEITNSTITALNSTNASIRSIDCSTIRVDSSANFNGNVVCRRNIDISGGSFQTLSGNILRVNDVSALTISCERLVANDCSINGTLIVNNINDINGNSIIDNGSLVVRGTAAASFSNLVVTDSIAINNTCNIFNLNITRKLDFINSASLILPNYSSNINLRQVRSLAVDMLNISMNIIKVYNSNSSWSNMYTKTHYAYLDLNSEISGNTIGSSSIALNGGVNYFIENSGNLIYNNIYKYIPLQFKKINDIDANSGNGIFDISNINSNSNKLRGKLIVPDLSGIYEINATVSMKYLNRIPGDVEPNNYTFGLYNGSSATLTVAYVENINNILTFDNSFNYSSLSLNYIGPLYTNSNGFIFLISSAKDINYLVIDKFNGSIKLLNY